MCGIFALLNNKEDFLLREFIIEQFNQAQHRGPDNSCINTSNSNFVGFHRLQINGVDADSNQPFNINNILLICNGEIYNYKNLFNNIFYNPTTSSDCEVIIYLYMLYGIEYTLNLLDGVFAFVLIDYNINKMFVCRDPYGVRPLFYLYNSSGILNNMFDETNSNNLIVFASEIKQLIGFANKYNNYENDNNDDDDNILYIKPCLPGEYLCLELSDYDKWYLYDKKIYNTYKLNRQLTEDKKLCIEKAINNIHDLFYDAVKKRVDTSDRPIACLLSGGLDSSIVTALVQKIYKHELETYSIGLEGSEDLLYARKVATFLGTKHTEVIVSEDDFFNHIPDVIQKIESYDTTTVRASVGNYLVGKFISENSEAKVIFNGDGSDELMGGYLYTQSAPNHLEFDKETKRLLEDIYMFDVLRSDRSISTNGLEPRTPFLDRQFVDYYLSLPSEIRYDTNKIQEKYLFRKAFDKNYLPKEVLWRRKEAFSDGVSSLKRSWYKIIEERVQNQTVVKYDMSVQYNYNAPQTLEQLYYRTLYERFYPNMGYLIAYFWMPKFINANDSSARTLEIYNKSDNEEKSIDNLLNIVAGNI